MSLLKMILVHPFVAHCSGLLRCSAGRKVTAAIWQRRPGSMCLTSFISGLTAPLINDISTDLVDPPKFKSAARGPLPKSYVPQIQRGYPDLKTLKVKGTVPIVYDTASYVAKAQPQWEVTYEDKDAGCIEGVSTTPLLRFKDDFTIRVAKGDEEGTSWVDMRSKSRVGQGDFGTNAARIQGYFKALQSRL